MANFFFGTGILIWLIYGIVVVFYWSVGLNEREKCALLVNFLCPFAKYYYFRERTDWENIRINFNEMLMVDMFVSMLL
jgi:hypothetical protein